MAGLQPVLFYSPNQQLDTAGPDEYSATKNEDKSKLVTGQNPEQRGKDLPECYTTSSQQQRGQSQGVQFVW